MRLLVRISRVLAILGYAFLGVMFVYVIFLGPFIVLAEGVGFLQMIGMLITVVFGLIFFALVLTAFLVGINYLFFEQLHPWAKFKKDEENEEELN